MQGVVKHSSTGVAVVIDALEHCRKTWSDRSRFTTISAETHVVDAPPEYHAAIVDFVNAFLASEADVSSRLRLRSEMLGCGLGDGLAALKKRGVHAHVRCGDAIKVGRTRRCLSPTATTNDYLGVVI